MSDPTVAKGMNKAGQLTAQQKVDSVLALTKDIKTSMLTSRCPDGQLASRAMIAATVEGLVFSFYFNTESGKTEDLCVSLFVAWCGPCH